MDIKSREISDLLEAVENVRRRKIVDKDYTDITYIDPLNCVSKLKIQNNHIISGRRGCGKTTLMLASINNRKNYMPITVECQNYRRDNSDTIIIKFLIKILEEMQEDIYSSMNKMGIKEMFDGQKKELLVIDNIVNSAIEDLEELKNKPDVIKYKIKASEKYSEVKGEEKKRETNRGINSTNDLGVEFRKITSKMNILGSIVKSNVRSSSSRNEKSIETEEEHINTILKEKLLDELIEAIANILNEYNRLTKKEVGLYLDDFYQIALDKQTRIIQYLHDVYKNCRNKSFCFKICTLPNRLKINYDGENILSIKDDFSTINLDRDLSNIDSTKEYLLQILSSLNKDLGIKPRDIEQLFSNKEALFNLIIGSGGIPRDFIIMFADVVSRVRANNEENITKSIIYSVVTSMRNDKDENIEFDADVTVQMIEAAIQEIEKEIVINKNTNVFLFSHNQTDEKLALMRNLVNSRYLHVIKEKTSSENRKKEMFTAYLVDMSFYINGKQKKRNFNDRPFWERDEKSRLKHIESAPIFSFQ